MPAVGLIGKKCGMTSFPDGNGKVHAVTVIEVPEHVVTQLKTPEREGYSAVQVAMGKRRNALLTRPERGHFAAAGVEPAEYLHEFTVESTEAFSLGQALDLNEWSEVASLDIQGVSKGKGFAGTVKRHNFRTQDATHGNSLSHRVPGSTGQNQTPGRVFKNKKMAGHMGSVRRSTLNLSLLKVDLEKRLLVVKGAIPGAPGGYVVIRPSKRKAREV